ncbi:Serine/threonine-protein kinase [Elasticomyces elasticus]
MSSAATQPPTTLPRTPSRRQPPPTNADYSDRPHRTQSTNQRSTAPTSPRRSASASTSQQARGAEKGLQNVAQRDFEQTNLAQRPASQQRRSESRDRSVRTDTSMRAPPPAGHARTQSRYNDQPTAAPASTTSADTRSAVAPATRRRTTIDAATGHWDLGKTIGAGSMGKVKLARNKATGEQVAVKIVPRGAPDESSSHQQTQAERDRAERSKEVRTAREAAIVTLVDHPHICGMKDVLRTNYHWYMLFEYVNGGQMLDYIISHGRLKEKQARKFGRQISSALDYCHRNSIVHRDLKIENILISKNGDIKIIDFGLSNLFSPKGYLKTFCGSLYFAAPELLMAKEYRGPEVDVWSFGIVLYVLVCGKVPFDDQSMPQLHAKIKRGGVEYPPWLSPECRGLIARMLNTNPQERATLAEIMQHPWMTKGYQGPPDNYLPSRKPLQLPLDPGIIDKMTGFDFGPADVITSQLTKIMESDDYQRAVRANERRGAAPLPDSERKRGVFDFYKRRNSTTSRDTLNTPSSEGLQLGNDPINAFHPLISVYYLAMEKQEREAREANPGALAMPDVGQPIVDMGMGLPKPPAMAVTNAAAFEMPGEKPTGGRTRPRARTHGEDDAQDGLQKLDVNTAPSPVNPAIVEPPSQQNFGHETQPPQQTQRKESVATGLLRRLSTRRTKEAPAAGSERVPRSERPSHPPPSLAVFGPGVQQGTSETPRKSFSVRRTRERDPTPTGLRTDGVAAPAPEKAAGLLSPPLSGGDGSSEKKGRVHGLGRSVSVNSSDLRRRLTRRGVSEGSSMRPPMTSAGSTDGARKVEQPSRDAASDVEGSRPQPGGMASRTKSVGHARRESMQARRAVRRDATRQSDVPEETDQDVQDADEDLRGNGAYGSPGDSSADFKPVFLKGVFSVSTTSSKPLQFIRADIIRVLTQLGVEFNEIRGGFRCRHRPSIRSPTTNEDPAAMQHINPPVQQGEGHRRKISFSGFNRGANAERDAFRQAQPPPTPKGRALREAASYENTEGEASESDEDATPTTAKPTNANRIAGETSTHVQTDLGESMVLKFEIFVVKVPLIGLHGVQFKKIEGGTWSYKNMAQTILNELRL